MEMGKYKPGSVPLALLCVICDRDKHEKVLSVMEGEHAYVSLALLGKGTANSHILGYLGLGETEKTVFLSIKPTAFARTLLQKLDEALEFAVPGNGVAFMTLIHEGCYHKLVDIARDEAEEKEMQQEMHDLIMVILNRGYTEDVMDTARAAGATGGTVLHARGCGLSGAEKFFGITIQPEREVIMIVADRQDSCGIMQAIADKTGPETQAGAVSFSMPVDGVRGISSDVPDSVKK